MTELYSLRWNNHPTYMMDAVKTLFKKETLNDIELVCANGKLYAHKVVLSASSNFFRKILTETPTYDRTVIILSEFEQWHISTLLTFMYTGSISIEHRHVDALLKIAYALEIKGLTIREGTLPTPITPPELPMEADENLINDLNTLIASGVISCSTTPGEFSTTSSKYIPSLDRYESISSGDVCGSPLPRRKQARPRRRSGELTYPQDLSNKSRISPPPVIQNEETTEDEPEEDDEEEEEDTAEDLCLKKEENDLPPIVQHLPPVAHLNSQTPPLHHQSRRLKRELSPPLSSHSPSSISPSEPPHKSRHRHNNNNNELDLTTKSSNKLCKEFMKGMQSPPLHLLQQNHHIKEFGLPPPHPGVQHPSHGPPHPPPHHGPPVMGGLPGDPHSMPYPPMPAVAALAMSQSHNKFFSLDSPLGLFPPGLEGVRNPLLDLTDPANVQDQQIFSKKKMGRPKGQHSAPRGGPPRSWTNGELTKALLQVWNKHMTTSQASRVYGIPYNSLLMYVRGKYGKSLKLEQLRNECTGAPPSLEMLGLNGPEPHRESKRESSRREQRESNRDEYHKRPPKSEESDMLGNNISQNIFNHFGHPNAFYPDFGPGFPPLPVGMLHLLPQAVGGGGGVDKNRNDLFSNHNSMLPLPPTQGPQDLQQGSSQRSNVDEDGNSERSRETDNEDGDMYRPPVFSAGNLECKRELVQQNGQD